MCGQIHVRQQSSKVDKKVFGNTYATAVAMLSNFDNKWIQRIKVTMCKPLASWHFSQSSECRSAEGCARNMLHNASGGFFQHLVDVCKKLVNASSVQYCGLCTGNEIRYAAERCDTAHGVDVNHPFIAAQNERATLMGRFAVEMVGARMSRCLWLLEGWPLKTCLFVLDDQADEAPSSNPVSSSLQ